MCGESVPKQSAIEPVLMFSSNALGFLKGNWHDNNSNCGVQFNFLSLCIVLVFSTLLVKPVPSHLDNNSSVILTLRSKVQFLLPHKHLCPTRYLKIRHSPWKQKNNVVLFPLYILTKHNSFLISDFQNYLRTQMGNTTTVNIIISTVDYLLRLQVRKKQMKMDYKIFVFLSLV